MYRKAWGLWAVSDSFAKAMVVVIASQRFVAAADPQIAEHPADPAELAKTLASPSSRPTITKDGWQKKYKLPSGYNRNAQERVYEARRKLLGLGIEAFQQLIEHLDDERYSMTVCGVINEHYFNLSVGDVCRDMLFCQIEPVGLWTFGKGPDPRSRPVTAFLYR